MSPNAKPNDFHGYSVDDNGRITNPGKFEGENAYMPLAYDAYIDGCADELENGKLVVDFPEEAAKAFLKWRKRKQVRFYVDDNGFVTEC